MVKIENEEPSINIIDVLPIEYLKNVISILKEVT